MPVASIVSCGKLSAYLHGEGGRRRVSGFQGKNEKAYLLDLLRIQQTVCCISVLGSKVARCDTDDFIVISWHGPRERCIITTLANRPDKPAIVALFNYRIMRPKFSGGKFQPWPEDRYVSTVLYAR